MEWEGLRVRGVVVMVKSGDKCSIKGNFGKSKKLGGKEKQKLLRR
jgi:hypothetical protein